MRIYTRTGDGGETGLFAGARVAKDDARIEALGSLDELNALLGVVRAEPLGAELDGILLRMQHEIFGLGAELASPSADLPAGAGRAFSPGKSVAWAEEQIDQLDALVPPLREFILPGGTRVAALLHLARAVFRRAERRVVSLHRQAPVAADVLAYLNRLGDLLFMLARHANHAAGRPEEPWRK